MIDYLYIKERGVKIMYRKISSLIICGVIFLNVLFSPVLCNHSINKSSGYSCEELAINVTAFEEKNHGG